ALDASTLVLDASIHPRAFYHQLTTLELARQGSDWSFWTSLSRESPIQPDGEPSWTSKPMGPAWIASLGGSTKVGRSWTLGAGLLWIDEAKREATEEEAALHMPPRFLYERAGRFSAEWAGSERFTAGMNLTHDFRFPGNLVSLDARWQPRWAPDWRLSVGTDFFSAASPDGFIGQYVGDDRVRVGVRYEL
ncbi:MAG TPA: hypothetical protein VM598_14875, partial [Bdellovibrionota bacterium]|nr:hypothetical protein [Bdellovibrionota bacterium]